MRGTCLEQQVMITNNSGLLFTLLVYDAASLIPSSPPPHLLVNSI